VRKQHQVFLPAGSQHEAYVRLRKIFTLAKREILIVDNYVDHTLWELLTNTKPKVKIRILTDHMKGDFRLEGRKFAAQYGKAVEVRKASNYHDRFIIQDVNVAGMSEPQLKTLEARHSRFPNLSGPSINLDFYSVHERLTLESASGIRV